MSIITLSTAQESPRQSPDKVYTLSELDTKIKNLSSWIDSLELFNGKFEKLADDPDIAKKYKSFKTSLTQFKKEREDLSSLRDTVSKNLEDVGRRASLAESTEDSSDSEDGLVRSHGFSVNQEESDGLLVRSSAFSGTEKKESN